ncbi:MAG TPA: hypothetical protein VF373_01140, partial [Prolixibacteraceae bacterium]
MKANRQIEDKDWASLAKAIYDENPENKAEKQSFAADEVFSDEKERKQFQKITQQVDLYFDLKKYPAEKSWEKVESR